MIRFLVGLIVSIVGIPVLLLFLLIDFTPDMPYELFEVADTNTIISEEVNLALEGIESGEVKISLKEDNLNKLIYNYIIEQDQYKNYAPGKECNTNECEFIDYEEFIVTDENSEKLFLGITGIWVEFFEDVISLNITVSGHYYVDINTSLKIDLEVLDNEDSYTLAYSKVSVGNIGLPKAIVKPVVNKILNMSSVDPTDWNTDYVTYDMNKLGINVDKKELVNFVTESDQSRAGLNLVMDNQLVKFDIFEENPRFEIYVNVDKLTAEPQLPEYLVDFDSTTFDIQSEIQKELNMVMVGALSGDPKINITEKLLNKMLAQTLGDIAINEIIPEGDMELNISVDGAWIEFLNEELELNFQMNINGVKILLELNNSVNNSSGDLVFTINNAFIGRDEFEEPTDYVTISKEDFLAMFGNLQFEHDLIDLDINTGTITITKESITGLIDTGTTGIAISNINLTEDMITVGIDLPQQELLDAVVKEVETVIDSFEGGVDFIDKSNPEEVAFEEKVTDIATKIDVNKGEVNVTTDDIQELSELYYEMPEETQQEFIDYVKDSVDQDTINDFLDSFMNLTE